MYSLVFEKLKKISLKCTNYLDIGFLTNTLAVDTYIIAYFFRLLHSFITFTINMTAVSFFLIYYLGWVGMVGIGIVICYATLINLVSRLIKQISKKKMFFADDRNRQVRNVI